MKILFTVQGEGRGHLTQALTLRRLLAQTGHEVVGVVVGKSPARQLPKFFLDGIGARVVEVESPNFLPSAKACQVPLCRSVAYNLLRAPRYFRSIRRIRQEAEAVDVVVNFYELLTGLAFSLFPPRAALVCVAHQYLFLHPSFRFPQGHRIELSALRFFTRCTALGATRILALSFRDMPVEAPHGVPSRLRVVPPLLREAVRRARPTAGRYLHGYLLSPVWADEVRAWHRANPTVPLHFYWDKRGAAPEERVDDTLTFHTLNDKTFIDHLAHSRAYATTADFESVCEAMYLGKPVLMVPTHIEQLCNAVDAELAGAGLRATRFSLDRLSTLRSRVSPTFRRWVDAADVRIVSQIENAAARAEVGLFRASLTSFHSFLKHRHFPLLEAFQ